MRNMQFLEIKILYQDDDTLILDKPAGISVHGDGKNIEVRTVVDFILENYPEVDGVGEQMKVNIGGVEVEIKRPGVVHRIDKDTSGVLLVAKNQNAYEFYKEQFKDREVKKVYHAFAYGWPKEMQGIINEPIGRARSDVRRWAVGGAARGEMRDAQTEYKILGLYNGKKLEGDDAKEFIENFKDNPKGNTDNNCASLIELRPHTGRTHQIRVHLKSINHPIVCDSLYAPNQGSLLGFHRLALHAYMLTIKLLNGETKTFTAEYREDFENAISAICIID